MKYIFVTGGVVSGLGKGITAASLGRLLKARGYKVASQKLDPYINIDPGTMSPYQHGEVFVTDDGAETDLDLGHYERFIDENLNKFSNLTTGKVYWNVLNKERNGEYLGQTVQVIPHITGEIKSFIYSVGEQSGADIVITEIGGTIGDIESQPFIEAIRQVSMEAGRGNCCFIHVTLVPYISGSCEFKSKPTQHSVKELQGMGIAPDVIVARVDAPLPDDIKQKDRHVLQRGGGLRHRKPHPAPLVRGARHARKGGLSAIVCRILGLPAGEIDLSDWEAMLGRARRCEESVRIALVGKYVQLHDAYLSVAEALTHAGFENAVKVEIEWVDSEVLTADNAARILEGVDGILVPGGFGGRGIEGKIAAAKYARETGFPYLGICLGMQVAVIEFARSVLGYADADSSEFSPDGAHSVIDIMPDQRGVKMGGTMRLGAYPCRIAEGSVLATAYGRTDISERHRHRFEFNNDYREAFEKAGMRIGGTSPDGRLVEAVELPAHPFYVGVQFHPEFKSRPNAAHPLFRAFVRAARMRAAEKIRCCATERRGQSKS